MEGGMEWKKHVSRLTADPKASDVVRAQVDGLHVRYYPCGGGFERLLSMDDFSAMYRPISDEEYRSITCLTKTHVTMDFWIEDENPPLRAWTSGERWNGWSTPLFERGVLIKAIKSGHFKNVNGESDFVTYDDATETFTVTDEGGDMDPEVVKGEYIETPEGTKLLYRLGDGWTWFEPEMTKPIDGLSEWYKAWTLFEGLPHVSADELIHNTDLTGRQRRILSRFIDLWETVERLG